MNSKWKAWPKAELLPFAPAFLEGVSAGPVQPLLAGGQQPTMYSSADLQ